MFRNYFKTAWRNLIRYKSYTAINVLGLALGIASCLLISLVVQYELKYDAFHRKADRIYRVTFNDIDFNPCTSMAIAPALRNDFPELQAVSQVWFQQQGLITVGQNRYEEKNYAFADQYFTSLFDYHWLEGNPKTALAEPNTIVLTKSYARKYFNTQDPMGKIIGLENQLVLKVKGIIDDLPGNTHLPFNFLISFETVRKDREKQGAMSELYWINSGAFCYILAPPHFDPETFKRKVPAFIKKNWGEGPAKTVHLPLQPLRDIHFDPRYLNNTISYTTSRETYYALAAVAVLIIVIACINFINLATTQAVRRAKEVGVRKVLGSSRRQLITQFLGETAMMVLAALMLGICMTVLFIPTLSAWLGINISSNLLLQPVLIAAIAGAALVLILLAGLYPAFIQSAFNPIRSLKSAVVQTGQKLTLRKSLVVVQFTISQMMIIGTLVVAYQMDFFQNRNLGFDKEAVISFGIPDQQKTALLREQLSRNPGVRELCFSSGAPVYNNYFTSFLAPDAGITKDDVTELKFVDEQYTDMFRLQMIAGEKIKKTAVTDKDTVYDAVVNETMIHKLGIQDPRKAIGRQITLNGNWRTTIAGVVSDFQSESKHKKIRPCVLIYRPDNFFMASVRIQPASMNQTISSISSAWTNLFPSGVFSYEFLDDHIAAWYQQEHKEYVAFKLFAAIAILIGCLGLYGLVSFAVAQRVKEVGIRKVLGASLGNILFLFSKEFVALILLAFVIAIPVAYYFMNNWLQGFAYQISIGPGIFLIAMISSLVIAAITILHQAIKAGLVNPVKSLRTE